MPAGKLRSIAGGLSAALPSDASELAAGLANGTLSVEGYLEARVNEAMRPLEGLLSPDRVSFVRQMLKEQLSEDPVLSELLEGPLEENLRPDESGAG